MVKEKWFAIDENGPVTNPDPRTYRVLETIISRVHKKGGACHIWMWGSDGKRNSSSGDGPRGILGEPGNQIDRRNLRYFAARIGPLPGWTMGYGFDTENGVATVEQLDNWKLYLESNMGWDHFLGSRVGFDEKGLWALVPRGPRPEHDENYRSEIKDEHCFWLKGDYMGYTGYRPLYRRYREAIQHHPEKPSFEEDRFRLRNSSQWNYKDYNEELTRRGLWHSALAGGVANIWGNLLPEPDHGGSNPYAIKDQIKTYSLFFKNRFLKSYKSRENDGQLFLVSPNSNHAVIYAENTAEINFHEVAKYIDEPVVAVDAKKKYSELKINSDISDKIWRAPYKSDWAIAIGDFLNYGSQNELQKSIVIDETDNQKTIEKVIEIDSVWAGHPVGFCLLTHGKRQYIAYYNANRNMVVGQRNLSDDNFELHVMPATKRKEAGGTSTVLGWDSHNYVTLGIDKKGFIHLSGNMHVHPLTYFRSTKPHDITTLKQHMEMVGENEKRCTYPHFMNTRENELLFHYRDGGSGNGNEIYNIYDCETKEWTRLLDSALTDGQGLMNAYQTQPTLMKDNWYHVYWVWRDTPDCSTNHDLSYMKSPDLENWYNAFGEQIKMPATIENESLIVDPIPVEGGIINLAAKLVLDDENNPVFVYHKFGPNGNTQFFTARLQGEKWIYKQITDWDYRWFFSGNGSINSEIRLKGFEKRNDGFYEVDYWHIKYGNGTLLLNDDFERVGKVLKPEPFNTQLQVEGDFPGLLVQTRGDLGEAPEEGIHYMLKWETLNRNRDDPRPKPWPEPSRLVLYKLKSAD